MFTNQPSSHIAAVPRRLRGRQFAAANLRLRVLEHLEGSTAGGAAGATEAAPGVGGGHGATEPARDGRRTIDFS